MNQIWTPTGCITWTTDFGLDNAFVGTMRGVFANELGASRAFTPKQHGEPEQHVKAVQHIDLTHRIPAQAVEVAALELRHAYPYFPAGTLHIAIVDPGVGTDRRVLAALVQDQVFVGPDNGLLPSALNASGRASDVAYFEVDWKPFALAGCSATFHGRDVFTPVAAALFTGRLALSACSPCPEPVRLQWAAPAWRDCSARSQSGAQPGARSEATLRILMIDRFGNLITDWDVAHQGVLPSGCEVRIGEASGPFKRIPIAKTYAALEPGEPLALINSWGHLELAVRDGSASQTLGLRRGDRVRLCRSDPAH